MRNLFGAGEQLVQKLPLQILDLSRFGLDAAKRREIGQHAFPFTDNFGCIPTKHGDTGNRDHQRKPEGDRGRKHPTRRQARVEAQLDRRFQKAGALDGDDRYNRRMLLPKFE